MPNINKKETKEPKGTKKSVKEEDMQGMQTPQVYAVRKSCDSCDSAASRVQKFDPMMGIASIQMSPEHVHGVYFDEKGAMAEAEKLQKMYEQEQGMLEEKRSSVAEKLTKKIEDLEKERTSHFKSKNYDEEAAVATKIQDLKDKLKKVEKATKIKKKIEEATTGGSLFQQVDSFVKSDLKAIEKHVKLNDAKGTVVLRYGYWKELPSSAYKALASKFNVHEHEEENDDKEIEYSYEISAKK